MRGAGRSASSRVGGHDPPGRHADFADCPPSERHGRRRPHGPGGDADRARAAIANSTADATVVLAHWGNEYETEPAERVRTLAASFVQSGAALIIGTHPHVIGTVEDIDGARVYYSLGNFVFDQYWEPSVRCGLTVKATFTKEKEGTAISFQEERVGMRTNGRTAPGCL